MSQPPPQTTVIVTGAAPPPPATLNVSACRGLGATQLTIGILLLVIEIILIAIYIGTAGQGFWAGIFVIVAGALGLGAASNGNKGLCIATGVLSIIAAVICFIGMIVAFLLATGAGVVGFLAYLILEVISGILMLVEVGVGIAHAVIALKAGCARSQTVTTAYVAQQPGQPGYPVAQPGYPVAQQGYPVVQQGYPVAQPGYNQPTVQAGYGEKPAGQPGY